MDLTQYLRSMWKGPAPGGVRFEGVGEVAWDTLAETSPGSDVSDVWDRAGQEDCLSCWSANGT